HPLLHVGLDGFAVGGENAVDSLQANDLAHDALGHRLDRLARIENVEHIVFGLGRIDLPVHPKVNVDDVLIPGKHLALFWDVRIRPETAIADFGDLLIPDWNLDHGANWPGPVGVEASGSLAGIATENEIDPNLARLDCVERSPGEPEQQRGEHKEEDAAAAQPFPSGASGAAGSQFG